MKLIAYDGHDYDEVLAAAHAPGSFFLFSRNLLWYLAPSEAVFLSFLINQLALNIHQARSQGGWFYFAKGECTKFLNYSEKMQRRSMEILKKSNLVDTKQNHQGVINNNRISKRMVRIKSENVMTILMCDEELMPRLASSGRPVGHGVDALQGMDSPGRMGGKEDRKEERKQPSPGDPSFLFPEDAPKPKGFDEIASLKLHKALQRHRKLAEHPYTLKGWATEFKYLRADLQDDKERIKSVLIWYMKNMSKKYVPAAYSAKTFKQRFSRIEDAMNRYQEDEPAKVEELPEPERHLVLRILDLQWPKASTEEIKRCVMDSWTAYIQYKKLHKRWIEKIKYSYDENTEEESHKGPEWTTLTMEDIRNNGMADSPALSFLTKWFRRCRDSVESWDKWNGSMKPFQFHTGHRQFLTMYDDISPNRFEKYLKAINEN